jgi:hypothetical protein
LISSNSNRSRLRFACPCFSGPNKSMRFLRHRAWSGLLTLNQSSQLEHHILLPSHQKLSLPAFRTYNPSLTRFLAGIGVNLFSKRKMDDRGVPAFSKVIAIRATGAGKTSIVQRYSTCSFQQHKLTVGVTYVKWVFELEWNSVTLKVWDIADQERFQSFIWLSSCRMNPIISP